MAYTITEACQGCQSCVRICPTQAISGERHGKHSIDPQRCIECGACGRICPYSVIQTPDGTIAEHIRKSKWVKPAFNHKKCVSCGLCIIACPVSCLDLDDHDGRNPPESYPFLKQPNACIGCSFCASICPVTAITMVPGSKTE